ncbi:hypothetical protein J6590_014191 [Homalodisca vitripennis]|nr:hypothetical protein J6590_014191 [Homalodisca vitripennis]
MECSDELNSSHTFGAPQTSAFLAPCITEKAEYRALDRPESLAYRTAPIPPPHRISCLDSICGLEATFFVCGQPALDNEWGAQLYASKVTYFLGVTFGPVQTAPR